MISETDVFLNTDDFAEEVMVTVKGALTSSVIDCLFNEPGQSVAVGNEQVITTVPTADCKTTDVSALVQGSTLVRGGVTYYVDQNIPQGDGFSRLILSRDPV